MNKKMLQSVYYFKPYIPNFLSSPWNGFAALDTPRTTKNYQEWAYVLKFFLRRHRQKAPRFSTSTILRLQESAPESLAGPARLRTGRGLREDPRPLGPGMGRGWRSERPRGRGAWLPRECRTLSSTHATCFFSTQTPPVAFPELPVS